MSAILIISKDLDFRDRCRSICRKIGYSTKQAVDIIDGLTEMRWFDYDLVLWDIGKYSPAISKALTILQTHYKTIPILYLLNNYELLTELKYITKDMVLMKDGIELLSEKIIDLIGMPEVKITFDEYNLDTESTVVNDNRNL